MAQITRKQLLDLESDDLATLVNAVPGDLQDEILGLLAGITAEESIEIPNEYLQDILDKL